MESLDLKFKFYWMSNERYTSEINLFGIFYFEVVTRHFMRIGLLKLIIYLINGYGSSEYHDTHTAFASPLA